jgi:hypothetical protein
MNSKRILLGGLAAAVPMFGLDVLFHALVLKDRYAFFAEVGRIVTPDRETWVILALTEVVVGLMLASAYAVARKGLGPGPRTALVVGAILGVLYGVPAHVGSVLMLNLGKGIPFYWAVLGTAQCVVGTLVAGRLYKDA